MKRKPSSCKNLITIGDQTVLTTGDLIDAMGYTSGYSFATKFFPSPKYSWQMRHIGGLSWKGEEILVAPQLLNFNPSIFFDNIDLSFADKVKAIYRSKLFTYELNYIRHITPRYINYFSFSLFGGLAYIGVKEKLKVYVTKDDRTNNFSVHAEDTLFGPHIGAIFELNPLTFFTWGVSLNLGGMFNRASAKNRVMLRNNLITVRDSDLSGSNFAYTAQGSGFIELRPGKHFVIRLNYQFLYLGDIATASSNIQEIGSSLHINHSSHITYHGALAGIQFNF